jgi:hypothetical protein
MNEANLALRQLAANIKGQLPASLKNVNVALDLADAGAAMTNIWGAAGQVTIALNTQGQGSFNVSVQLPYGAINVHAGPLSMLPAAE